MKVDARNATATKLPGTPLHCAIYTRKSTEEGLEQDFNTLDAQREAAMSFIDSQRGEGWVVHPEFYDDGGFTGANMDRPALQRLLSDVASGLVHCVVVYKVDRLSRSLLDFTKIMEILDRHGVTFVSVTQQFNTTSSLGRLTLHILLSFAQFEREMISERTRDKMCAARKKGKWVGGALSLGYDLAPGGGSLVVNTEEAERVRAIFALYLELGSLIPLVQELNGRGWTMKRWTTREGNRKGGAAFNKTTLHNLLTNVIYTGRVKHRGQIYAGEHPRLIDDRIWNEVQERLNRNGRRGGRNVQNKYGALLKGIVRCESCNVGMTHTYVTKAGKKIYRYYVCINAHQKGWNKCETRSVSAAALEAAVLQQVRSIARAPGMASAVRAAIAKRDAAPPSTSHARLSQHTSETHGRDPEEVISALDEFDPLWGHLTTWEQERFLRALVSEVGYDGRTGTVTVRFVSGALKDHCIQQQPPK